MPEKTWIAPSMPFVPSVPGGPGILIVCGVQQLDGLVTADMVELSAFSARADALGVRAVPAVVVNGTLCFLGAKREEQFVEAVLAAVPND